MTFQMLLIRRPLITLSSLLICLILVCASKTAFAAPGDGFSIGAGISQCILKGLAGPRDCHRLDSGSDLSPIPDWGFWPQENYEMISDIGRGKFGDLFDKLRDVAKGKAWSYVEAWALGDPHIVSFTGDAFDFMAHGEFNYLTLEGTHSDLVINARHRSIGDRTAVIDGVSVQLGENVIEIHTRRRTIMLNGAPFKLKKNRIILFHDEEITPPSDGTETPYFEIQGALLQHKNAFILLSRDLHTVVVQKWPTNVDLYVMLNLADVPRPLLAGGVLGSPTAGLRFKTGNSLPTKLTRAQFQKFAEDFELSGLQSRFRVGTPVTYDPSFPVEFVTASNLSEKVQAKLSKKVKKLQKNSQNEIVRRACLFDLGFVGKKLAGSCKTNKSEPTSEITLSEE